MLVLVEDFATVLVVVVGFTFCLASEAVFVVCRADVVVAELVVAGRAVDVAGLLTVAEFVLRLAADEVAGFVVVAELVVAGRVVVVAGLVFVVVVGRP